LYVQTPPTADEAGHCHHVRVDEIGDTPVVVFKQGERPQQHCRRDIVQYLRRFFIHTLFVVASCFNFF